ncbi:MAG: hypothetical protein EXS37_17405 [Opitutus sp.]|nr:hypothetical protein [Opitutus sp.]
MAVAMLIVVRACGYEFGTVGHYLWYVGLHVALPGSVAMYAINRGPLSLSRTIALALPTGFALEIFTFLGLASVGAKDVYPWVPLGWAALAVTIRLTRHEWPARARMSGNHAGIAVGLAFAFLATLLMAASQMFAESPLAQGLPTRAIFHDWVYLVSRAAVIKNNWPLDDPSLSGTPLQYHYFMMVHAAAVSWTTGIEITAVMLRLIYVPLGAVLVAQAFVLGRAVSRSPWGGVVAALLTVIASEMSFAPSYGDSMFLGLFVRWLFVSPTFFFGMIFCGALLLAVAECVRVRRCTVRHFVWLLLLGTAGTGAKGTVLPVIVCAVGVWVVWRWLQERRVPVRLVAIGACLIVAFAIVYVPTMSHWRTGDAALRPFHVFQLTGFWKEHLPVWTRWLAQWLPGGMAATLAGLACAAIVFAGTCGVRLLAIPYLFWGECAKCDRLLVGWTGSFFVASAGMGMLMELNSYGELYLILMMRLPMAVLTAAFFVSASRRFRVWWHEIRILPLSGSRSPFARREPQVDNGTPARCLAQGMPRVIVASGVGICLFALGVQTSLWWRRNQAGFGEWLKTPTNLKPDGYMRELQEALLWVRHNTESDALLVANACTPENMRKDHWGALDRTLTGVHFYYSALSERRLWFEGPNYILDTTRARIRANLASNFFYRGRPLASQTVGKAPSYILLDRSLNDGAVVTLPFGALIFSNSRMEVYRLSEFKSEVDGRVAVADGSQQ